MMGLIGSSYAIGRPLVTRRTPRRADPLHIGGELWKEFPAAAVRRQPARRLGGFWIRRAERERPIPGPSKLKGLPT
jgi:hypothetical protein